METIEELKKERFALIEAISEMDRDANKVEIYEMYGEMSEIERKIHAIDPSQVWMSTPNTLICFLTAPNILISVSVLREY